MEKRREKFMTWTLGILVGSQFLMVLLFFLLRPGDTDLFSKGTLRLETGPSAEASLLLAHAHPRSDSLFIEGRLRAESDTSVEQKGTIRISVVSPDGAILEEASGVYQLSRSLRRGGGSFSVGLARIPPKNSTVRIAWGPDLGRPDPATSNDAASSEH